jgi:hypothetical protein
MVLAMRLRWDIVRLRVETMFEIHDLERTRLRTRPDDDAPRDRPKLLELAEQLRKELKMYTKKTALERRSQVETTAGSARMGEWSFIKYGKVHR